ncbi:helix-turn-helix domain-containing protein [Peptostreptococcus porci]|uniref:helix-turn-helix domain-containing protein n=1 Tax=Peptostreptococcus porci TaxID=2652282 RepID=UPI0023F16772|nr:helix-turn-helix transcriptional regulator [Peptostreptococcus porci]MDD7183291.1 helix-turn-helix transcriptional regulator [Peptostreptococcus porci]MDY4127972.1 helix-turn-helix transcriptional regulator [Peptostreptococcus porci]MDY4561809.1 helix-turn-helix transcriptional regulator [Peptostreptococcus porci]
MLLNMKIARYKKGITQKQLSLMTGISKSTIARIESNSDSACKCAYDTLIKLSKALDITVDELIKKE